MAVKTRKARAVGKRKIAEIADKYVTPEGAPVIAPPTQPEPEYTELPGTEGITGETKSEHPMLARMRKAVAEHKESAEITPAEMADVFRPKSVVKPGYKRSYLERAAAQGLKDKFSRRGCGDWLQRELQAETERDDGDFDLDRFTAILDANGVDYSKWNTTTKGWQGRFRMSGSIVLRGRVGKSGLFHTPEGTVNVAELAESDPNAADFIAKWAR